jgi:hypothetical protein
MSHFTDPKQPTDSNHRIDWIGTGPAYKRVYELLIETQRINNPYYAGFFAAHFTKKGKLETVTKTICDWTRSEEPSKDAEKLRKILQN